MEIGGIDSLGQIKLAFSEAIDISEEAQANVNNMFGINIQGNERIPGTRLLRRL